jgi:demethylmenaquinone methyltransferase/2-methoxy-6-polyprenyl-1,4-benzoquinol methylase
MVDFHKPSNLLFWPGLTIFLWLFETETSWQLLETDLVELLKNVGFGVSAHTFHAGGSLQVIQAKK